MFDYQNKIVPHVSKVTLSVSDLERSVKFYQDLLGLSVFESSSDLVILASKEEPVLTLLKAEIQTRFAEGLYHVAFILPSMEALAQWYLYHSQRGYQFPGVANHLVSAAFYLSDPDGNGVEVYADTDPSTWEKRGDTIHMDTLPLDIRKLTKGVTLPKALNPDVRIGHLHLKARTVTPMKEFYQSLGMDLKLNMGHAVFLSFSGYHHHLGINQWNREMMSAYQENQVGIHDFEIRYPSQEFLESVVARLEQSGHLVFKNHTKFVVKDPIGIQVHLHY